MRVNVIEMKIDSVYDQQTGGTERYTIVFSNDAMGNPSMFRQKQCLQFTDLPEHKEGIIIWRAHDLSKLGEKIKYSDLSVDIRDRFKNVLQAEIYDEDGELA